MPIKGEQQTNIYHILEEAKLSNRPNHISLIHRDINEIRTYREMIGELADETDRTLVEKYLNDSERNLVQLLSTNIEWAQTNHAFIGTDRFKPLSKNQIEILERNWVGVPEEVQSEVFEVIQESKRVLEERTQKKETERKDALKQLEVLLEKVNPIILNTSEINATSITPEERDEALKLARQLKIELSEDQKYYLLYGTVKNIQPSEPARAIDVRKIEQNMPTAVVPVKEKPTLLGRIQKFFK